MLFRSPQNPKTPKPRFDQRKLLIKVKRGGVSELAHEKINSAVDLKLFQTSDISA